MKKLLLALLLLLATLSYGQARIGYSKQDIKREFASKPIYTHRGDDGTELLYYDSNDEVRVIYCFNEYNICSNTTIITKSKKIASDIMNLYDTVYLSINSYKWRALVGDGALFIEFGYDSSTKIYSFQWYANN